MKKYVIGGIIATILICTIGIAVYFSSRSAQTTSQTPTTITSSTTTTEASENSDTRAEQLPQGDKESPQSDSSDTTITPRDPPKYQAFSPAAFKATAGTTRILFFYDAAHAASNTLDTVLTVHANELPQDTYVFKVLYADEQELASSLSVTQPGTVLKYDRADNLAGIYIAVGVPDMPTFRRALAIEEN